MTHSSVLVKKKSVFHETVFKCLKTFTSKVILHQLQKKKFYIPHLWWNFANDISFITCALQFVSLYQVMHCEEMTTYIVMEHKKK